VSWNQRQANCNVNWRKPYDWISSKLTPADASHSCASFCIWDHSCVDLKVCAIAVSLPSTANLFLHSQQLRDKNSKPCQQILRGFRNKRCQQNDCWTRTTLTGVSKKKTQCTNSKGYFKWNFVLQSWILVWTFGEIRQSKSGRVRKFQISSNSIVIGNDKNMKRYYECWYICLLFDAVISSNDGDCCSALRSCTIVHFAAYTIQSQFLRYILNILRKTIVIVLQGLKILF